MSKAQQAQGMYIVNLVIEGVTPLQQSKEYSSVEPRSKTETADDYEKRTWKLRSHINSDGYVFHPSGALKKAMIDAARYSGEQIEGQGKKTYTAKVTSGVCVASDLVTDCKSDAIERRDVYASAQGGKGKNEGRVWKYFPTLAKWKAQTTIQVYDPIVTPDVLRRILEDAGRFIGIGTWRPQMGGEYGRFKIVKFEVSDL